jgi:hypothetical protein
MPTRSSVCGTRSPGRFPDAAPASPQRQVTRPSSPAPAPLPGRRVRRNFRKINCRSAGRRTSALRTRALPNPPRPSAWSHSEFKVHRAAYALRSVPDDHPGQSQVLGAAPRLRPPHDDVHDQRSVGNARARRTLRPSRTVTYAREAMGRGPGRGAARATSPARHPTVDRAGQCRDYAAAAG